MIREASPGSSCDPIPEIGTGATGIDVLCVIGSSPSSDQTGQPACVRGFSVDAFRVDPDVRGAGFLKYREMG